MIWLVLLIVSLVGLIYAQVIYPVAMMMIARLGSRGNGSSHTQQPGNDDLPKVTLIIPAHNEEAVLQSKIENSLAFEYPQDRLEIIVASDESDDRTVEIAQRYSQVICRENEERLGKAGTITAAAAQATGDVLCFCDANVMFRPLALRILVQRLIADQTIGIVYGNVVLQSDESTFASGESLYYDVERSLQLAESGFGTSMGVEGGMFVIRREHFVPLKRGTVLDDFETMMNVVRQRLQVIYEPTAIADENGTATAWQEFQRRRRIGEGVVQSIFRGKWPRLTQPVVWFQFASHKLMRWLGPFWLLGALIGAWMSAASFTFGNLMLWLQVTLYLLAIVSAFSLTVRDTKLGGAAFYFALGNAGMAYGFLRTLVFPITGIWHPTERITDKETAAEESVAAKISLPDQATNNHAAN